MMEGKAEVPRAMRPRWLAALASVVLAMLPVIASPSGASSASTASEWRNPKNTVHIRLRPCGGDKVCGTVIWASDKAKADAARGGTRQLVGANLFRDFREVGPGRYKGRVFVPDMNRTFSGQMHIEGDSMIGKGCVLGLICKQQVWTRIS